MLLLFKIFMILLFIPWSLLALLTQYIWSKNIVWVSTVFIVFAIWASLLGLIFYSSTIMLISFISIWAIYLLRYIYSNKSKNALPVIKGKLKHKPLDLSCTITLSFLKIFNLLPKKWEQAITKSLGLRISCSELIQLVLYSARGTSIYIKDKQTLINLSIQ